MTQKDKELLLKDLCARLPYGIKIHAKYIDTGADTGETEKDGVLSMVDSDAVIAFTSDDTNYYTYVTIHEIKPYLRSLSSMTEEQLKEMQEIIGNPNEACISVNTSGLELWLNSVDTDPTIWLDTIFEVQDWLNRKHFDYRGLIDKGLAIDCTNLNIY